MRRSNCRSVQFAKKKVSVDLNFSLPMDATPRHRVTVIGSAPIEQAKIDVGIVDTCNVNFVDFYLAYSLDPSSECHYTQYEQGRSSSGSRTLSWIVEKGIHSGTDIDMSAHHYRPCDSSTPTQWRDLEAISDLPIVFFGLPQPDMSMQGRAFNEGVPRGTLRVPCLVKKYGVQITMPINNVDNAFVS